MVISTTSDISEAEELSNRIVKEKLAACVNIFPQIKSVYWWEGEIEKDEEALLLIKTNEKKLDALLDKIEELHSYDTPEALAIDIEKGSPDYLEWVEKSVE